MFESVNVPVVVDAGEKIETAVAVYLAEAGADPREVSWSVSAPAGATGGGWPTVMFAGPAREIAKIRRKDEG